jgi:uncharacterized protein YndB with AHSA1/START domain
VPAADHPARHRVEVRRLVRAAVARVFAAWTSPEHLRRWWGPRPVTCSAAEIELRPGGRYRIANRLPDGTDLWITGEFERVSPPHELVYSWRLEPAPPGQLAERVTVRFLSRGPDTEVVVTHEQIGNAKARDSHQQGWQGCLEGLAAYLAGDPPPG